MLKKLLIQNYAIIKQLEIDFSDGMVIITGETGAGKSILMGALGLALGDRADGTVLRNKESKTIVEANFELRVSPSLKTILMDNDLDSDGDEIILRREILQTGKSRSFINDTPVSLTVLGVIASHLVDLHLQFDTLELGSQLFQQQLLDTRAGASDLSKDYLQAYHQYREIGKKIEMIRAELNKAEQEREYKLFLLHELDELNWKAGEAKAIDDELNILTHADQVRSGIGKIGFIMSEGEQPLLSQLRGIVSQIEGLQQFHPGLQALAERISSAYVELKDVSSDLEDLFEKVLVDDKRMEELNNRMAIAQRLSKKHAVSLDDLIGEREKLASALSKFEKSGEELADLEKQLSKFEAQSRKTAEQLGKRRKAEVPKLEDDTKLLLQRVGMPNAQLKIELRPIALSASGNEQIHFLFDANKSGNFEPLQKVASGGELSRLMLVLKSLVADSMEMPTLIFDEIDSGISGEAAKQVGLLMEELSTSHQLIAITHQPQIAARARQHLFVYKHEENGKVNTGIRELPFEERVKTIAQMLAGENPSESVLASAREMVAQKV